MFGRQKSTDNKDSRARQISACIYAQSEKVSSAISIECLRHGYELTDEQLGILSVYSAALMFVVFAEAIGADANPGELFTSTKDEYYKLCKEHKGINDKEFLFRYITKYGSELKTALNDYSDINSGAKITGALIEIFANDIMLNSLEMPEAVARLAMIECLSKLTSEIYTLSKSLIR